MPLKLLATALVAVLIVAASPASAQSPPPADPSQARAAQTGVKAQVKPVKPAQPAAPQGTSRIQQRPVVLPQTRQILPQAQLAQPKLTALGRLPENNLVAPSPDHLVLVALGENLAGSRISGALAHLPDPCDYRCTGLWEVFRQQLDTAKWTMISGDRAIAVVEPALTQRKLRPRRVRPNAAPRAGDRPGVRVLDPNAGYIQSNRQRWDEEGFLAGSISLKFHPKGGKSTLWTAEGTIPVKVDDDRDGVDAMWAQGTDCDDQDPNRFPGNPEIPDTRGHDEDCDLDTIGDLDRDGDGYVDDRIFNEGGARGRDCNDERENINPGVAESTNNRVDDDCDGEVDEFG